MGVAAIDWTMVIDTFIYTLPLIVGAIFARKIHVQLRTPSGKSLGEVAEYAHDTAIANNLLLRAKNGPTKPAEPGELRDAGSTPPSVPDESSGPAVVTP